MSDFLETLDKIFGPNGMVDSIVDAQESTNKFRNEHIKSQTAALIAQNTLNNKNLYELEKEEKKREYNTVLGDIKNSMGELELWGLTSDIYNDKIKEKFKTKEFQSMLDETGTTLKDQIVFNYDVANNVKGSLNEIDEATKLNNEVLNVLSGMQKEIYGLKHHYAAVGTEKGFKAIVDEHDINEYISKNPEIFTQTLGELDTNPPNKNTNPEAYEKWKQSQTENFLSIAFRKKQHEKGGKIYGYTPSYTADQRKEFRNAGLDSTFNTLNINANMAQVNETLGKIRDKDKAGSTTNLDWLKTHGLNQKYDLKGTKDAWDKPENQAQLKANLEQDIIKLMDYATTYSPFPDVRTPDVQESLRGELGFTPNTPVFDVSTSSYHTPPGEQVYTNVAQRNKSVRYLFERYVGGDKVVGKNPDGTDIIDAKPKISGAGGGGGLLNQEYADDLIYLKRKAPDSYGNNERDKLLYDLLNWWDAVDKSTPGPATLIQ